MSLPRNTGLATTSTSIDHVYNTEESLPASSNVFSSQYNQDNFLFTKSTSNDIDLVNPDDSTHFSESTASHLSDKILSSNDIANSVDMLKPEINVNCDYTKGEGSLKTQDYSDENPSGKVITSSIDKLSLVPQEFVNSVLNNMNETVEENLIVTEKEQSNIKALKDVENEQNKVIDVAENSPSGMFSRPTDSLLGNHEPSSEFEENAMHSNWRMLADGESSYYWNVDTGATQYETPSELKDCSSDDEHFDSVDSSLADLEGAAFRYAALHVSDDNCTDQESTDWTISSDVGRMFSVRSLGWLPLDHVSSDPEVSSSEVNACIQHLSSSHGQIMDGVGAWGEGKDLMLLIEDEFLKLLDPVSQTVLQTQAIKHIRIWGVGGNSAHDFAYVARDNMTRHYKCHVFRSDASAKAIAKELHTVCEKLSNKSKKVDVDSNQDRIEKEKIALSTQMPVSKSEQISKFSVVYLGSKQVESVSGIKTVKNVIREITTSNAALCQECVATVTASALIINHQEDNTTIVNCRMRCLSFMGIGDDISIFAFINVVGNEAKCHIVQCLPNAAKLALSVQEACMLRFQKAVDSKSSTEQPSSSVKRQKSFKQYFKNIFAKKNS